MIPAEKAFPNVITGDVGIGIKLYFLASALGTSGEYLRILEVFRAYAMEPVKCQ
jgi:hypothetical protein